MPSFRPSPRLLALCLSFALAAGCSHRTSAPAPMAPTQPAKPADAQWQLDWVRGSVFYEILVRSFSDSDGDGHGDLQGLIAKLDYLNDGNPATTDDLGVDAIWLLPIFESPSYHGYDAVDYEHIERDYGTDADFTRLCDEAHRRGMRVIIDYVMNHTSREHPWFVQSAASRTSPFRDYYVWHDQPIQWKQPWGTPSPTWHELNGAWYYGMFWGGMPDLNFNNAEVREHVHGYAAHWLKRGADGFRLDATRYLFETGEGPGQADTPQTHAFLKEFSGRIRALKPDAVLVGENWTDTPIVATYFGDTSRIALGDELPMNFNFPLADKIVDGVKRGRGGGIAAKLAEVQRLYPRGVLDGPFLTNHDQTRIATEVGGDLTKLATAAAVLLTMPGAPFLYYGEEVGLRNGPDADDRARRTPMPWRPEPAAGFTAGSPWYPVAPGIEQANVATQSADPNSLLSRYRSLIRTRKASAALREGELRLLSSEDPEEALLVFVREARGERILVAHNLGSAEVRARPFAVEASAAEPLLCDAGAEAKATAAKQWSLTLPAGTSGVWKLR